MGHRRIILTGLPYCTQDRAILDRIRAGDRFGHEINGSKAGDAALALHREHNIAAIHIIDRRIQSLRRAGKVMFSRKARRPPPPPPPEPKERNVTATDHTRDHEYLAMGRALERACRSLPEGWSIRKALEYHAEAVYLSNPDGNESIMNDGDLFKAEINAAIDEAISAHRQRDAA